MVPQHLDLAAGTAETLLATDAGAKTVTIETPHAELGGFLLHCDGNPPLLFTENDTNNERIFGKPNATPYVKDAFNNYVVAGRQEAINPTQTRTKAAAHYQLEIGAGETSVIRLRLSNTASRNPFGGEFNQIIEARRCEADEFYEAMTPAQIGEDMANVKRQALAGMLWSKQYFFLDADKWLEEHGFDPMRPTSRQVRNRDWFHMISDHVISMPDKGSIPGSPDGTSRFTRWPRRPSTPISPINVGTAPVQRVCEAKSL